MPDTESVSASRLGETLTNSLLSSNSVKSKAELFSSTGGLTLPVRPGLGGGIGSSSGSNSNVYSNARNRVGSATGFELRLPFAEEE